MKNINTVIVGLFSCLLISCSERSPESKERLKDYCNGKPVKVAETPDGVALWKVYDREDNELVYFSGSGTKWNTTHQNGKTRMTEHHYVPNQQ